MEVPSAFQREAHLAASAGLGQPTFLVLYSSPVLCWRVVMRVCLPTSYSGWEEFSLATRLPLPLHSFVAVVYCARRYADTWRTQRPNLPPSARLPLLLSTSQKVSILLENLHESRSLANGRGKPASPSSDGSRTGEAQSFSADYAPFTTSVNSTTQSRNRAPMRIKNTCKS